MVEAIVYVVSSFWLGALHALTPGHAKTVTAAYLVGARGRLVDAITLGLVVTLAHTGGLVLFGLVGALASTAVLPYLDTYVTLVSGLIILVIGLASLWQLRVGGTTVVVPILVTAGAGGVATIEPTGERWHRHGADEHRHAHAAPADGGWHRHGLWGHRHASITPELVALGRPGLGQLVALGIAGGLLPGPGEVTVLLAAINSGRLILGLLTVIVYSLGFASVLVVVGVVAARAGSWLLARLASRQWIVWLQLGTALVITSVGLVMAGWAAGKLIGL